MTALQRMVPHGPDVVIEAVGAHAGHTLPYTLLACDMELHMPWFTCCCRLERDRMVWVPRRVPH